MARPCPPRLTLPRPLPSPLPHRRRQAQDPHAAGLCRRICRLCAGHHAARGRLPGHPLGRHLPVGAPVERAAAGVGTPRLRDQPQRWAGGRAGRRGAWTKAGRVGRAGCWAGGQGQAVVGRDAVAESRQHGQRWHRPAPAPHPPDPALPLPCRRRAVVAGRGARGERAAPPAAAGQPGRVPGCPGGAGGLPLLQPVHPPHSALELRGGHGWVWGVWGVWGVCSRGRADAQRQ